MATRDITVFTDGAAKGNPGPGGWAAVVITPDDQVVELGGGSAHTTNNKMEIGGALHALEWLRRRPGRVVVHTDSAYLINGITKWIHGWRRKGWKTASGGDVLNRELWEQLSTLIGERGKENGVRWMHVRGHAGVPGNERCDEIAVAYSNGDPIDLYRGPLNLYDVLILDGLDGATPASELRSGSSSRSGASSSSKGGKPFSYLSLIGGVPMRHSTWPECERRVKGQPGARFKKAMSADDERAILRGWGLRGDEL